MKKILLFLLILASPVYADGVSNAPLEVTQADGSSPTYPYRVRVDHTDNGGGVITISGGGAPTDADYLVGTANGSLSAEIVVGTTPGGELGGTWGSPTVDTTHSGSAHHDAVTLGTDADILLGLSTQQITLDSQTANYVLAGPTTGAAADPTFRALVDNDIPDTITLTNLTQITTRSHTALSDIGTNTHAQVDTHIAGHSATVVLTTETSGNYAAGDAEAGGATDITNGTADATLASAGKMHLNTTDEQLSFHSAADGEISGEASISLLYHLSVSFDPDAVCDGAVDRVFLFTLGDDFPEGITIDEWKVSFEADPTTEADLDLKYADAWIGVANATVIDVLDTLIGVSSEDTDANINGGAVVANAKVLYLEFGTAYTETGHQMIFEMWFHAEED